MESKLIALAHLDLRLRRFYFVRWIARAILLSMLILAWAAQSSLQSFWLGIFFILLPIGVLLDLFHAFVTLEAKKQSGRKVGRSVPVAYETALLLARAKRDSRRLWYYLLKHSSTRFVLTRLGIPPDELQTVSLDLTLSDWWSQARARAEQRGEALTPEHLFEAAQAQPVLGVFWQQYGISVAERRDVWQWYWRLNERFTSQTHGVISQLRYSPGIGRDWASGYTHALEAFASNLTQELQRIGNSTPLVGHVDERRKLIEYLSRSQVHNALLVGEEGIGKETLLLGLAADFNRGEVPRSLRYKHIYRLDVGLLLNGASQQDLETRLHACFQEAATVGNVILLIPDIHLLIGAQGNAELGMVNASAIVSSYLQSSAIQTIGTTTPDAYYRFVKPNATLAPYLLPIDVKEMAAAEALAVIQDEVFVHEHKARLFFTYQALRKIIEITERHVHDQPYPQKALNLLDEVAGALAQGNGQVVYTADVERVLSQKLKVPMGSVSETERDVLNSLEQLIGQRVIGQREAVRVVADALRRARAGLHSGKRPIGSFLFLGPTGVGKTEMAKTIAALYYKNEKAFIRIDMSEYQTPDSIERLIGNRQTPGILTTAITDQPFSVVLLDEIEKADRAVQNLFLQILDDGHVTDGFGRRVDFTNAMVIATSNAGSAMIRDAVAANAVDATFKQHLLDALQTQGVFTPEWLNRFDAVVVFLTLTRDEIRQVAQLQVAELVNRLKSHNINLRLSDDVYDYLVEKGYDPEFGARPMRRAVQDTIESALAKALLNDSSEGTKDITLTREMLSA